MGISAVRQSFMTKLATLTGVTVPADPLPREITDKTIVVFPRIGTSMPISRGRVPGSVGVQSEDVLQIEYHRRVPYEHLGSTMGDITDMIEDITELIWAEHAGGKFDGTVTGIQSVALAHFGAIGWNEWTFGARLEVAFMYHSNIEA